MFKKINYVRLNMKCINIKKQTKIRRKRDMDKKEIKKALEKSLSEINNLWRLL